MRTKFLLLPVIACILSLNIRAAQVSVQDAQNVAINFYKLKNSNAGHGSLSATLKYTRTASDNTVLFYVFNISPAKGFVIISATDYDIPVIAYSTESYFGNDFSKTGLNAWLTNWSDELHDVISNQITASPKAAVLWSAYRQGIAPAGQRSFGVNPLCNTAWAQYNPDGASPVTYNLDCPNGNGNGQAISGDVATAMAQIMKYWNFPANGVGTVTYDDAQAYDYTYTYGEQTFNYGTTNFNWANMPDSLTNTTTPTQNSAVAVLMSACGVAVHTDYGPTNSDAIVVASQSTYEFDYKSAQTAFPATFSYNYNTLQGAFMVDYSDADWLDLLENELNNGRPVEYQGFDEFYGSHSWVCDGYDADDDLHMNWGWGGTYNGYYAITNLDPDYYDYTYSLAALIGIEPGLYASAANSVICAGDSTQITLTEAPGHATYTWAPTAGLSCSTCENPKASPSSTTAYTVTVDSGAYSASATLTISVVQPNVFSYSLSDSSYCEGGSATISLPGVYGAAITPASSVTWIDSFDATLSPAATTTYQVTSQSSVCGAPDTGSFTVHVTQYSPVSISLSDSVICEYGDVYLTITGLTNVEVSPEDYYEIDDYYYELDPYYTTTTYTITGTTSCGGTYTDSVTVYVVDYDVPYTLSKSTVCQGDTSILTVQGVTDVSVTPPYAAVAIGNNQYLLTPGVTTEYEISAYSPACDEYVESDFSLHVIPSGGLDYMITPAYTCQDEYVDLYLYGVIQPVSISPYIDLYWTDANDAYGYFYLDSTTTFTISAQTVCGTYDTAYATATIEPQATAVLSKNTICSGGTTLLTLNGLTDPEFYPETDYTEIDSNVYEFFPSATTYYEVYGYSCDDEDDYIDFTIAVEQPGVLNYNWEDSIICSGSQSELYLYGVTSASFTPYLQVNWTDSTDAYVYMSPAQTTTYSLTANTVCSSHLTHNYTVTVNPEPSYNLQSSTLCTGGSTTMTVDGLSGPSISPMTGVTWLNDSLVQFNPAVSTNYTLTGIACTGYEDDYYIDIAVLTAAGLNYSIEDSVLCPGDETYVYLSGAYNISVTPYMPLEYEDSSAVEGFASPGSTTTYTASGTSVCNNEVVSDSFTIYVSSNGTYILSNPVVCNGDSVLLTPVGLDDAQLSPLTYTFQDGNGDYYLNPPVTTTYTLSGYSLCTDNAYNQDITVTVSEHTVSISTPDTVICAYDSTDICAITGFTSYVWNTGQSGQCVEAYLQGNYSVFATDANNCTSNSTPIHIGVINESNAITVHGDTLVAGTAAAYQWLLNDAPVANATSSTFIATQPGTYTVQLTTGECQLISNPYQIAGISNITANNDIQVYPNPGQGHWFIQNGSNWIGSQCTIYDARGKLVYSGQISSQKSEIVIDLAAGVYMMRITSAHDVFSTRLVKM